MGRSTPATAQPLELPYWQWNHSETRGEAGTLLSLTSGGIRLQPLPHKAQWSAQLRLLTSRHTGCSLGVQITLPGGCPLFLFLTIFLLDNIKDFSIISPELGFLTCQKAVKNNNNNIFVQSSMISHLRLLSTMTDGRCYDAHWAKEKTKAQSALVIYPMPQMFEGAKCGT